jgi:hypothetical protein
MKHQHPCVPRKNGVVEQKNHTLVEMERTMVDEHRLLDAFGPMRSALHVISPIESSCAQSSI